MSAKIYAILTILVVGIGSFLIGWFLTSTRWKKRFFEADRKKKILENKTDKQATQLDKSKAELRETKQQLFKSKKEVETLEKELSTLRKNHLSLKDKSVKSSFSDKEYNKLLNELNLEKKKNATLKADIKRTIGTKKIATTNKKRDAGTRNNLKSSPQRAMPATKTTKTIVARRNTVDEGSPLFPILQRISIFSNMEQEDELTLIDGIDEALANQLNDVGIINFKQIAMLTKNDLNTISLEMKMDKSQAMNDSWVAQARSLYYKKYSR